MKLRNVNMLKCEKKATFVVPLSVNPVLAFVKLSRKTETEKQKLRETFYEKKLVKLTNPDTRARVFILLFTNSFLFCFFL